MACHSKILYGMAQHLTLQCKTPAKFEMVVNLKTAKGIRIILPLLAHPDEVIE